MVDEQDGPARTEPSEERLDADKKRLVDRVLPELVKRMLDGAVERGVERLADAPDNVRNFVGELKLPKEVLHYLYTQIDETKNGLYRVVAKEIRDVMEHTQFAEELTKVLTKLSFEIKTEIRFVPNPGKPAAGSDEEGDEGDDDSATPPAAGQAGLPKPQINAQVSVKDRNKESRRDRRRGEGT